MHQDDIDTHQAAILTLQANFHGSNEAKRANYEQSLKHQNALADAYGVRRGWRKARKRFVLGALAVGCGAEDEWPHEFADHRSFWEVGGRPFAVCAHLYGCDEDTRSAARAWAASRGLTVSFPVDFPSWYYPGRTTLIEITRAE
jgi:hypothetical protein